MAIYSFIYLFSCILSFFSDFLHKKVFFKFVVLFLLAVVLGLFAGLRGAEVGVDTLAYYRIYDYVVGSSLPFVLGYEPGFVLIVLLSDYLGVGAGGSIFLSSIFTSLLVVLAANRFSVNNLIFFSVYFGLSFYILSFNIVRQSIAMAIILNGSASFSEGRSRNSAFWILLAMCFHYSAVVGFFLLIFRRLRFGVCFWLISWILSIFFMLYSAPLKYLVINFSGIFGDYQVYLTQALHDVSGAISFRDVFYQFLAIVVLVFWNFNSGGFYRFLSMAVIFSVISKNIFFDFGYVGRLSVYFEIFISLYLGYLLKVFSRSYGNLILSYLVMFLMFFLYYRAVSSNSSGVYPYYLVVDLL